MASWEQVSFGAASQPLLSAATSPSPPPPTLIPGGVAHSRSPFPSGSYTSPGFEDFLRCRSLGGCPMASWRLPSAPVGSAEPEGKQPWVAPSLPDAFLA